MSLCNANYKLQDERAFSTEEEQKLQAALELEAKDLELVLDTIAFILEQVTSDKIVSLVVELCCRLPTILLNLHYLGSS